MTGAGGGGARSAETKRSVDDMVLDFVEGSKHGDKIALA